MKRVALLLPLLAATGCATARLVGAPAVPPPGDGQARTVVLEPFFESAAWETSVKTEYAEVQPGLDPYYGTSFLGAGAPTTVAVQREVTQKPLFARVPVLAELQRLTLVAVQKLRPGWRVSSTSVAPGLTGPVTVVRTVIAGNELFASDRTLKNLAFAFGLVLWPLEILAGFPVQETQRVSGTVERFSLDGAALQGRLVRYATQPDFAVNLSGLTPLQHRFALDVSYQEGLLADERPRTGVLLEGFAARLAVAIVALVEEKETP